jgi:hypothetical protein
MSTDKLEAIHDTVAEILSEPPSSPHTYFDAEPHDVVAGRRTCCDGFRLPPAGHPNSNRNFRKGNIRRAWDFTK